MVCWWNVRRNDNWSNTVVENWDIWGILIVAFIVNVSGMIIISFQPNKE